MFAHCTHLLSPTDSQINYFRFLVNIVTITISFFFVSLSMVLSQFLTFQCFFFFFFGLSAVYCLIINCLDHLSALCKYLIINCLFAVLWVLGVKIIVFNNYIICTRDVMQQNGRRFFN